MSNSLPSVTDLPGADQVPLPSSTAVERIYAAYVGNTLAQLSADDRLVHTEMEAAYALILNYHTFDQAWPLLAKQFDLSRATCYRRLQDSQNLFGDLKKVKKEGRRSVLIDFSRKLVQLALSQRPPDTKGALAALKFEADITGLRRADAHGEDGTGGVGSTTYVINLQAPGRKPRAIDVNKLGDISDADYELVQQAVDGHLFGANAMEVMLSERRALEEGGTAS